MRLNKLCQWIPMLISLLVLLSCITDLDSRDNERDTADRDQVAIEDQQQDPEPEPEPKEPFMLQLLHFADVDGKPEALDNVENFSALVQGFKAQYPAQTILLSSGDNYIPGPRYFSAADASMQSILGAAGKGRADIAFLNALGVQASAVGNHELDEGTETFASVFASDGAWQGAAFPYLSANLEFAADEHLAQFVVEKAVLAQSARGSLAPSAVIVVNGEKIGVIGATTPALASITSSGSIAVMPENGDIAALASIIQEQVDFLNLQGINKIVLLAHMQQIAIEQQLAGLLKGVDIIVAGGSNTILADETDELRAGDAPYGSYPIVSTSPVQKPVLLVNTDGDYRYLGRLIVYFDADGVVIVDSLDSEKNGAYATTDAMAGQHGDNPINQVSEMKNSLVAVLQQKEGTVPGITNVYLEGRRSQVRTEETNLGNITADANLWYAQQYDSTISLSLKNGGGIRADIGEVSVPPGAQEYEPVLSAPAAIAAVQKPEGGISQFAIETTLRFNNKLVAFNVTGAELLDIMEHAVSATQDGATPGQFPQISGFAFAFDPTKKPREADPTNNGAQTTGKRILDLVVGEHVVVSDGELKLADQVFRLTTLNFLAKNFSEDGTENGEDPGDGYPFSGLTDPQFTALSLLSEPQAAGHFSFAQSGSEQDALAEYLATFHSTVETAYNEAERRKDQDERIQNLAFRQSSL